MEFFRELSRIGAGFNKITMTIMEKDGVLTLSFLPETKKDNVNRKLIPVLLTGTPMEVDEGFFPNIIQAVEKITGLVTNIEAVKENITEQEKENVEEADKPASKTKSPAAKKKPVKPAPKKAAAKPAAKPDKKKKPVKPETGPNSEGDKHHQADLKESEQKEGVTEETSTAEVGPLGF